MSFLRRVAMLSLRDRVRSSDIQVELQFERSQLRCFWHPIRMPPWAPPGGDPAGPEVAGGTRKPI